MRRPATALVLLPAALLLAGCVAEPATAELPISAREACDALADAVDEYHEIATPNSTVTELENYAMPEVKGYRIPKPTCAFEVRPDPAVIPGDVYTIESFYLDYDEELTLTLSDGLVAAGFKRTSDIPTWADMEAGHSYSAAMLVFLPGDGQQYGEAAEHFRVLDLTLGRN